jgi:hypothetical protein
VFIVNGSGQLQLNNTVAATSQLRSANTMVTLNDMEWRMRVKQSFAPSSSNFGRVYLVSDQTDLTGPLNGYYLQFGETGSSDAIELFEQSGTSSSSVCRGAEAAIAGSFDVGIRVKRDASGTWQLLVDPSGGTDHVLQASGVGAAHGSSAFIGVRCTYTVSNADKFFYDDLYAGPAIVDLTPPVLVGATALSATQVELVFNEAVSATTAEVVGNYAISPSVAISTAVRSGVDAARVTLSLASPLIAGSSYTVTVGGVQDLAGNELVGGTGDFTYSVPASGCGVPGTLQHHHGPDLRPGRLDVQRWGYAGHLSRLCARSGRVRAGGDAGQPGPLPCGAQQAGHGQPARTEQ